MTYLSSAFVSSNNMMCIYLPNICTLISVLAKHRMHLISGRFRHPLSLKHPFHHPSYINIELQARRSFTFKKETSESAVQWWGIAQVL